LDTRIVAEECLRSVAAFILPAYSNPQFPLLVCLHDDSGLPRFAEPMPRSPSAPLGALLDDAFPNVYRQALLINPELHDGALLAGRVLGPAASYSITGWSYRLYPPPAGLPHSPNRGSAFHSCRAMSALPEVDGLILFARSERMIFVGGELWDLEGLEKAEVLPSSRL
jgi:hypothetical protein